MKSQVFNGITMVVSDQVAKTISSNDVKRIMKGRKNSMIFVGDLDEPVYLDKNTTVEQIVGCLDENARIVITNVVNDDGYCGNIVNISNYWDAYTVEKVSIFQNTINMMVRY